MSGLPKDTGLEPGQPVLQAGICTGLLCSPRPSAPLPGGLVCVPAVRLRSEDMWILLEKIRRCLQMGSTSLCMALRDGEAFGHVLVRELCSS